MNKDTILKTISEQEIYLKFLNISEFPKGNISSPFCQDKTPSFKLYKNNSFKCHSTGYQGDVFQFVAYLKNLNCKTQFNEVLNQIVQEFPNANFQNPDNFQTQKNIENPQEKHFNYTTKAFTNAHLDYFMQGNWSVTKELLEYYNVSALDKFEFFNSKKAEISKIKLFHNIIGFAYIINQNKAELYIPKQEKASKFFINKFSSSDVFGLQQLHKNAQFVIICAGKKDCLILNANGFPAVTFRSENHTILPQQYQLFEGKNVFVCYDNDEPGQRAAKAIADKYKCSQIILPKQFNDVADFFLQNKKQDFQQLIDNTYKKDTSRMEVYGIFHQTEEYLNAMYKFRYNKIKLYVEIAPLNSNTWKELNENSLYIELQKHGIKISAGNLSALIKSDFCNDYNPIQNYFENLPQWDKKTDYIGNLAKYILANDAKDFEHHFRKWLVRSVFCAMDDAYFNKQALILVSNQNDGKTSFWNWLNPPILKEYYTDRIDPNKDGIIALARNFLINLDELASLNKQDTKHLKSLFSMKNINIRVPFGRNEANLIRRCSFVGSTNEQSFLIDETGSVRWLCFNIKGINWDYSKHCNVDFVWSQAYALYKSTTNRNQWDLSRDEIEENEKRNSKFKQLSVEQELIQRYFKQALPNKGKHFTSTDVLVYLRPLNVNINPVAIGRAMHGLGYEKTKENGVYGYWLHPQDLFGQTTPIEYQEEIFEQGKSYPANHPFFTKNQN